MTKDDHIRQIKHNIACYLNDPSKKEKMLFLDTETTGLDEDCTVTQAHDTLSDAIATVHVWKKL